LYLSLTLEHGSIPSSLAAIRATQPSRTLLRYTNGVLPINWANKHDKYILSKRKNRTRKEDRIIIWPYNEDNLLQLHLWQFRISQPPLFQITAAQENRSQKTNEMEVTAGGLRRENSPMDYDKKMALWKLIGRQVHFCEGVQFPTKPSVSFI